MTDKQIDQSLADRGVPISLTVAVSSAEILALQASPKLLIPAPGAGKFIYGLSWYDVLKFGTTPYFATEQILIQFGTAGAADHPWGGINVLDHTEDGIEVSNVSVNVDVADAENTGVYLYTVASPTGGDGSLVFGLTYRVIDLP